MPKPNPRVFPFIPSWLHKPATAHGMQRHGTACALFLALTVRWAQALSPAEVQSQVDAVIAGANAGVQWSVLLENTTGARVYYSRNPDTPCRPASNTKLFTTAGAFGILGPSYVWRGYELRSSSAQSPMEDVLTNSDNALADELYDLAGGGTPILAWCSGAGIAMTGAQMNDGSGLSYNNRFSSRQTIQVLRYMTGHYTYAQWATHLSVACDKGTLASRLCDAATANRLHGKTGTLTNGQTLALSGYIDHAGDSARYFFSIYCNSVPTADQSDTRDRIDQIATIAARLVDPLTGVTLIPLAGGSPRPGEFPGAAFDRALMVNALGVVVAGRGHAPARPGAGMYIRLRAAHAGMVPRTGSSLIARQL